MKIYILDDKDYYVNILKERLENAGYVVLGSTDAFEAMHEISEISDIDLLLLDYNMPLLNGLDFIKKIQAERDISEIKILIMANEIPDENMSEIKKLSAGIIFKPFILQDLIENIDFIFGNTLGDDKNKVNSSEIATYKKIIEDMRKRINALEKEIETKNIRLEEKDSKILQFEENQKLFIEKLNQKEGNKKLTHNLKFELEERDKIISCLQEELDNSKKLLNNLRKELKKIPDKEFKKLEETIKDLEIQKNLAQNENENILIKNEEIMKKNNYYRAYIYYLKKNHKKSKSILNGILEEFPDYKKAEKLLKKITLNE
ncbi:MAG: response regulator [Candidatus Muiribacteriota bacterium]